MDKIIDRLNYLIEVLPNRQITRVISKIPEEKFEYQCEIGENKSITLSELIQDYLGHMDHHLSQIFGTSNL